MNAEESSERCSTFALRELNDGKESHSLRQIGSQGRSGQSQSPDRSSARPTGVNIMEFCKAFNAATQKMEPGLPIPVVVTVYSDRSFTFVLKTPPTTVLLKKAAGIESGSKRPNTEKVGKITRKQLEEIARIKMPDLTAATLEAAVRTIAGSARSMGLVVED